MALTKRWRIEIDIYSGEALVESRARRSPVGRPNPGPCTAAYQITPVSKNAGSSAAKKKKEKKRKNRCLSPLLIILSICKLIQYIVPGYCFLSIYLVKQDLYIV